MERLWENGVVKEKLIETFGDEELEEEEDYMRRLFDLFRYSGGFEIH